MANVDLDMVLTGEDPKPTFLIDDLYYTGQMIIIAGEAGVGKSFLQYWVAVNVAVGLPVLGRPVVTGPVLYFDEENGSQDLRQYLRWVWRGSGYPDISILKQRLYIEHFSLAVNAARRYTYMAELAAKIKPSLIVIDTVTPCCAIVDENDNGEASRTMKQLRAVKETAGEHCTMVLLKHIKTTEGGSHHAPTIRGAKAWLGEADAVIYHRLTPGRPRTDGLRNSRLVPDKVRAFGLRHELRIMPEWVGVNGSKGISLKVE